MNKALKITIIVGAVVVAGAIGYKIYKNKKSGGSGSRQQQPQESPEVQSWINKIKADPKWLADVTEKAKNNKVTLQQQLVADAKWMIANG